MALVTPIAQPIPAFDSTKGARFDFTIDDSGDRIVASYIQIVDQATNNLVYQRKQENDQRYFILPPNTPDIINGHYYYYRVKTYNAQGQESLFSNKVPFYCYTTPVLSIINMPSGTPLPILETSNFEFKFTYAQAEGELLNYIKFDIYIVITDEETGEVRYDHVYTTGNLVANAENEYPAMVYGLIDTATYAIDITGVTVNNTVFTLKEQLGGYQEFVVDAKTPEYYSQIEVEPKCNEGYVEVSANLIVTDGESLYPPQYIGDESNKQIVLLPRHNYVKWTKGFSIQQAFTMGIWGKIGQEGQILELGNDRSGTRFKMYYRRGHFADDPSDLYDFIEVNVIDELGRVMLKMVSNPLSILMPNESYFIFFQFTSVTDITLKLIKTVTKDFAWKWNTNLDSEVYYGQMLPINWTNEPWKTYDWNLTDEGNVIHTEYYDPVKMQDLIPMTRCKLSNGIYDRLDITNDTTITPETYNPEWTTSTILDADFDDNISGGNTDMILSEVGYLRLKRRQINSNKWITLKQFTINEPDDFKVRYIDTCVPSGIEQVYAIIPVDHNKQETSVYITNSTGQFKWNGVFISKGTDTMKFISRTQYNSLVKNRQIGIFNPIASKYPVVVQNAATSYLSGTLSALILGENWEYNGRIINRQAVVAQLQKIHEWLDTGEAVVLKDWNGWVLICRPVSGDTVSFDSNYGNGVATASFNFVEQGKYDNQEDLYEAGIIDFIEE